MGIDDKKKVAMHANRTIASAIPRGALDDLNWMRGLAAIEVMASHVRGAFFRELPEKSSLLSKAVYLLTGGGHQAVIVFFVLSGFFIGTSVVMTTRDQTWSWKRFALRRVTRLYVVLIPALALTCAWDLLGTRLFGLRGIYISDLHAPLMSWPDLRVTFHLPVLLGNLAFLQDFCVPSFGSNTPLWSLSYEFWAYLAFPLLFRAVCGNARMAVRLATGAAGVGIVIALRGMFPFYFAIWSLGALVSFAWNTRPFAVKGPLIPAAAIALFTMALLVARGSLLHRRLLEDFSLGIATALFVAVRLAAAVAQEPEHDFLSKAYARWGDVLAGFSYTLYAAHYPVVAFFQTLLVGDVRWKPDLGRDLIALAVGAGILALYAYPLARITEARTDDVRRWLERRFTFRTVQST